MQEPETAPTQGKTSGSLQADNFAIERSLQTKGFLRIGGCDEAGRGPLAGPVVAGCVVLPPSCDHKVFRDSKLLSHKRRLALMEHLQELGAHIGIGIVEADEIDTINILQASLLAMRRSVEDLATRLDYLLVDGKFTIPLDLPQQALVKGESRSASIAASSIVAKVTRDRLMDQYHNQYPEYNFQKHKGYPTREHREIIAAIGPSPIHRRTFKGVREYDRD